MCLAELAGSVGDGLAAAREHPHLLAAVDQHSAGLRDGLMLDLRPPSPESLVAYAGAIRHEAHRHGWLAPLGRVDWETCDDWVLLRLLAVHRLAETITH